VGKTTLLLEFVDRQGASGVYAACDGPEAFSPGFWDRVWIRAVETAHRRSQAALFLDEVQSIPSWAARLKSEWDGIRRRKVPLHVVATGSSALRLRAGSRESLAGRFERLTLAHWSAAAVSATFAVSPVEAARLLVRSGSYPGAFPLLDDPRRWRAYIRDAIIEPAIGRDALALGVIRRPALLRQVFGLCASLPAHIVSLQKLQGRLQDPGALETIAHYLEVLEEAYLVTALQKYSPKPLRRRAAPPKLVTLNNALLAATDPQGPPDPVGEPARYGLWVENACLAYAWNAGQRVTYWREEPLEVDAVIEGSWGAWAIEVKTTPFQPADLRGLLEFCRRHPRFHPLVLTNGSNHTTAQRADVAALPWTEYLLAGPPRK